MINYLKDIESQEQQIDEQIAIIAQTIECNNNKPNEAITDGVADISLYLNSSPKVAWILKEPYDSFDKEGQPYGGGWSITKKLFMDEQQRWSNRSWQRVIYVMYGVRHNLSYSQMDLIYDNPDMGKVLREIAWINLSKMPAYSSSSIPQITTRYKTFWRPIVLKQLSVYSPEIIVFGNTLQCCRKDFLSDDDIPIDKYEFCGKCFINVYKKNGKILLDAYHPGFRIIRGVNGSVDYYVDSLIDAIKKYSYK